MSEEGVFSSLIGHGGAKLILREALRDGDVHILLEGPPGSGKSVALHAIERALERAKYKEARGFTETKLRDVLAENYTILLLDEIDAMRREAYNALPTAMEDGRVTKDNARDQYDVEIDTQLVAACNHTEDLPRHVADRFRVVSFEEYSYEEFEEVCATMLPDEIAWIIDDDQAREVARTVYDTIGSKSVRDARDVAKLADSAERIEDVAIAMEDSKAEVDSKPLTPDELQRRETKAEASDSPFGTDTVPSPEEFEELSCPHVSNTKMNRMSGKYRCPRCADREGVDTSTPMR